MHAKELMIYLFNKEFFESGGTIEDTEKILGLNQLKLLPEYGMQICAPNSVLPISTLVQNTDLIPSSLPSRPSTPLTTTKLMYQTLAALIDDGIIDIQKILFQYHGSWDNYIGDFCLWTVPKNVPSKIIPLLYMNLQFDQLSMFCTLPQGFLWKKFGYQYFNFEDRKLFQTVFSASFPAATDKDAIQLIQKAYQ